MSIKDEYDFSIIENTIKERVIETLEKELETRDSSLCRCEECVIDMVCYSLNRLTPKYSASLYGALYSRADTDSKQEEINKRVKEAVDFISEHTSHTNK